MNLALFDFDGTITNQDAFTQFLFFATPKARMIGGSILLSPVIGLYKLGWLPARYTRPLLARVAFAKRRVTDVDALAARYVSEYLPTIMRPTALKTLEWHKQRGDKVVVVSASLSPYLDIWCRQQNIEVVCSRLVKKNDCYTGAYLNGDCSLENKVHLLTKALQAQHFDLQQFENIYAYGDTDEDIPMLELADKKVFNWQSVSNTQQIKQLLAK